MKKKLLQIVICFFLILLLSVAMLFFATAGLSDQTQRGADLVLLNEIEQLSSGTTDDTRLHDAISALRESIGTQDYAERNLYLFWLSLIFLALPAASGSPHDAAFFPPPSKGSAHCSASSPRPLD